MGGGLPAAGLMIGPHRGQMLGLPMGPMMGQHVGMPLMGQPAVEVRFRGPSMRATAKANYKT